MSGVQQHIPFPRIGAMLTGIPVRGDIECATDTPDVHCGRVCSTYLQEGDILS